MKGYQQEVPTGKVKMSDFNIKKGETELDFWKREMTTKLEESWESIVNSTDLVSVKKHAMEINSGFLMFIKTDEEFVLNDSGLVFERIPVSPKEEMLDEYVNISEMVGEMYFGSKEIGRKLGEGTKSGDHYIDTVLWMPISSNLAIVNISNVLRTTLYVPKTLEACPEVIMSRQFGRLLMPETRYINQQRILDEIENMRKKLKQDGTKTATEIGDIINLFQGSLIGKHKDDNDQYTYTVQKANTEDTIYWNILMMNEALQYLCFKTASKIIPSIRRYNELGYTSIPSKKNYSGFIELITKLGEPK
jgi:hypothetical protein